MELKTICEETKSLVVTQLIGLGEVQRRIYESLNLEGELKEAYDLHKKELELLIQYQRDIE